MFRALWMEEKYWRNIGGRVEPCLLEPAAKMATVRVSNAAAPVGWGKKRSGTWKDELS